MSKDIFSMLKGSKISKPTTNPKKNVIAHLNKDIIEKKPTNWKVTGTHLITYLPLNHTKWNTTSQKIAAFDLDGTLINTKSGHKFSRSPEDWKWFNNHVKSHLINLHRKDYKIVIFTNQGGIVAQEGKLSSKSYTNFTKKISNIMQELQRAQSDLEIYLFASPKRPASAKNASTELQHKSMRKPNIGMWESLKDYLQPIGVNIDLINSFYVGDAAGRPNDFSDSDKEFAMNIPLKFKTPEEVFIDLEQEEIENE